MKELSNNVGLTTKISILYLSYGIALVVAAIFSFTIAHNKLSWQNDIWFPLLLIISAVGTLRLTKWGRWLSYIFSIIFLFAVPIGTLFGSYMLWHLTKFRNEFNNWF